MKWRKASKRLPGNSTHPSSLNGKLKRRTGTDEIFIDSRVKGYYEDAMWYEGRDEWGTGILYISMGQIEWLDTGNDAIEITASYSPDFEEEH